jgi:hypothetical protein
MAAVSCCICLLSLQVTEAQQQWWNFKADNFDSVLLFKVGKFYEVRAGPSTESPASSAAFHSDQH